MKILCPLPSIKSINYVISALALIAFTACQNKVQEQNALTNVISYPMEGKNVLLFIPLDGCGTCISNSTAFVNKNLLEQKKLQVHVYSNYDKKYLQFDTLVLKNHRLVIDSANAVLGALNVEQKPRVIFIEDGKIVEDTFYDNQNDTLYFAKIVKY